MRGVAFRMYLVSTYVYERNNKLNSEILSYIYIKVVLIVKLNNDSANLDFAYYPNTLKLELPSKESLTLCKHYKM